MGCVPQPLDIVSVTWALNKFVAGLAANSQEVFHQRRLFLNMYHRVNG